MPEGLSKVIKLIVDPLKSINATVTTGEMLELLDERRKLTYFTNECRR